MSELADAVGRAVLADAGLTQDGHLDVSEHLALVASCARAEHGVRDLLHRSVSAARAGGASWALIGAELGMSRQAAQQRFGVAAAATAAPGVTERWLGPVTAFDEMAELAAAGREGWRTVEAGMLSHRLLLTDTQWEHRRILWRASLASEYAAGWQVGCRAFPWIYLVRDLEIAPVSA